MCDCDCELPKQERWTQEIDHYLRDKVTVPAEGEWFIQEGVARRVEETNWQDRAENSTCYEIWVEAT